MKWSEGKGDAPPRAAQAPKLRIVYPTPGKDLVCWMLDETFLGFDAHWAFDNAAGKGRSILCTHPDKCVCDDRPVPYRWTAYIGIARPGYRELAIVSLTQRGIGALLTATGQDKSFRGLKVCFRRATEHPSSRLLVYVLVEDKPTPLPPAVDLLPSLEAVYGKLAIDGWRLRNGRKDGAT